MAESLVQEWNVWETHTMVLLSFMLQLFLLASGSLRRRNISGLLRALIWLCYVGADLVAVYALGLFSRYEDKYKLGRKSFGDTLPFLWAPFLLVHLGGQDSITAFSLEDNNLWMRHLLNLGSQGILALYVLWRSFDRISYSILFPAILVFLSGIIKYGERVWALKGASRNCLSKSSTNLSSQVKYFNRFADSKESYALQAVLLARGLFVGRTVFQLGNEAVAILGTDFKQYHDREEKLKMVVMELDMMFDLLYTKAYVLQRRTGVLFRCAAQALMVTALVVFMIRIRREDTHNKVNVTITYTLFGGAIFIETCCVVAAMVSPWTRAHLKESSSCLRGLCDFATFICEAVQCNKRHRTQTMGQFNFMDYSISIKSKPRAFSETIISAIDLDKQWRNSWYVYHINDAGGSGIYWWIINPVLEYLATLDDDCTHTLPPHHLATLGQLHVGRLKFALSLPFEHTLYRLHVYTDLHLSKHFNNCTLPEITRLKEECETLSNYMMYLMVVHPSMLPVSTVAGDLEPGLLEWLNSPIHEVVRAKSKLQILKQYTSSMLELDPGSGSPFEPEPNGPFHQRQSLTQIKEMWVRLLVYAAGKCGGELHARQLSKGCELITFVWLLMLHHGLGDQARELKLLRPNNLRGASFISSAESNQGPLYAFNLPAFEQADQ